MSTPTRLRHGTGQGGFTLIELMIVVGIAAVITSIVAIGINQASDSFALRRAANLTVSEVRRAQAAAVSERRDFIVEFNFSVPPQGLNVYRCTADACPDATNWTLVRTVRAPQVGMDGNWPASVRIDAGPSTFPVCVPGSTPGTPPNQCLRFGLFGEPATTGQVVLVNSRGSDLLVVVAPATGQVSICRQAGPCPP